MSRPLGRLRFFIVLLLFGAALTLAGAWALALKVDAWPSEFRSEEYGAGERHVVVTSRAAFGSLLVEVVREHGGRNWSPLQATGSPDSTAGGDQVTAWASRSADGTSEWLELDYATAVVPSRIDVYESCGTGALGRVTVFKADGTEVDAWQGADPTPVNSGSGVSKIPVNVKFETRRIKLYIDSAKVPGWNEVDAVGLVDQAGNTHWAVDARASTTYADYSGSYATSSTGDVAGSIPPWSGLDQPTFAPSSAVPRREDRAVEAHGWPFLAFWSPRTPSPMNALWKPVLPTRPIWRGLLPDAIFYGAAGWIVLWIMTRPRRFLVEVSRLKRGHCVSCGYDLGYDFLRGCPECGWRRDARTSAMPGAPSADGSTEGVEISSANHPKISAETRTQSRE